MSLSGHFHLASGGFLDAPSLTSNCSNLPFETQGEVVEAAFCSVQTRKWETESLPFPGPPRDSAWLQCEGVRRGACGRSVVLGEVVREQPPRKDWHPMRRSAESCVLLCRPCSPPCQATGRRVLTRAPPRCIPVSDFQPPEPWK